uniref:Uncharacterized protein n=1 Tax=Arundo donax TaxID=35708 RepID=A0A0A9G9X6_ARUDO
MVLLSRSKTWMGRRPSMSPSSTTRMRFSSCLRRTLSSKPHGFHRHMDSWFQNWSCFTSSGFVWIVDTHVSILYVL